VPSALREGLGCDLQPDFRAATTTLSASNVFVIRFVLPEDDIAKSSNRFMIRGSVRVVDSRLGP
jgi:hypothetical protein